MPHRFFRRPITIFGCTAAEPRFCGSRRHLPRDTWHVLAVDGHVSKQEQLAHEITHGLGSAAGLFAVGAESALSKVWLSDEEDEAWADL